MMKRYVAASLIATMALSGAAYAKVKTNIDWSVIYPRVHGHYDGYYVNPDVDKYKYPVGREATKNEIKAWDIDVRPDGVGLPVGRGTVEEGEELYNQKCQVCHGDFGAGGKGYPPLSGGDKESLKNQMIHPGDEPPEKTIGSYWPYASTLFWYVKSGMPFPHPLSLTDDQVYAITAYLLNINDITFKDGSDIEYLDNKNFLNVVMPNHDGFIPDVDGPDGKENMRKFLSNPNNYGQGTRCMHNCWPKGTQVVHIKVALDDGIKPPVSTERSWVDNYSWMGKVSMGHVESKEEKIYNQTCAACHDNEATGAPVVGDKKEWEKRAAKGKDLLYKHAIDGFNAMPPKGGNMELSDEDVKAVVDYMLKKSQ